MTMLCPTCEREIAFEGGLCPQCGVASIPIAPFTSAASLTSSAVSFHADALDAHLEGLSGWLIWIGFGLVVAPLKMIRSLLTVNVPFLFKASNQAYLAKHHAVALLVASEVMMNIIFIMSLLLLNYLFFAKKRGFPTYMIIFRIVNAALLLGNHIAFRVFTPFRSPQGTIAVLASIIGALVVIPYMLLSRRARITFVR